MNEVPLVSVVIPAYNTEKYIGKAIESVLQQTEPNLEIIVISDCSTDKTTDVVRGFADKRIKLLVNQQNYGASYSRNRGIRNANGRWIALLDSDDWYAPNRIERLLQIAMKYQAQMVADDLALIQDGMSEPWSTLLNKNSRVSQQVRQIEPTTFIASNSNAIGSDSLCLGLTKPLIERSFLLHHQLQYEERLDTSEDFLLYAICLARGAKLILFPEPLYFYRTRKGSLVNQSSKLERLAQLREALTILLEDRPARENLALISTASKLLLTVETKIAYKTFKKAIADKSFTLASNKSLKLVSLLFQLLAKFPKTFYHNI